MTWDCVTMFASRAGRWNGVSRASWGAGAGGARGAELGDTAPASNGYRTPVETETAGPLPAWYLEHRRRFEGVPCQCQMCRAYRGQQFRASPVYLERMRAEAQKRLEEPDIPPPKKVLTLAEHERLKQADESREKAEYAGHRRAARRRREAADVRARRKAEKRRRRDEQEVRVYEALKQRERDAYETVYQQCRRLRENVPVKIDDSGWAVAGLAELHYGRVQIRWCQLESVFGQEDGEKIRSQIRPKQRYVFNPKTRIVALMHPDPYQRPVW